VDVEGADKVEWDAISIGKFDISVMGGSLGSTNSTFGFSSQLTFGFSSQSTPLVRSMTSFSCDSFASFFGFWRIVILAKFYKRIARTWDLTHLFQGSSSWL
jgi:hypothetical protein